MFDIETEGWDRFLLGGWYDGTTYHSFRDENQFFDFLMEVPGELWTFNGGKFDINWFLELAKNRGYSFTISCSGSRVTNVKGQGRVLRDLAALLPGMDLQRAATIADIELTKETGIACVCGDCEGYCGFRRDMPESDFQSLDSYLFRDCHATYHTKLAVDRIADECGYLLAGTIGQSTWKTVSKQYGIAPAEWELSTFFQVREAFYGGRCQVFRPYAERGYAYDLNSAYPAALRDLQFPLGESTTLSTFKAIRAFARRVPGFYSADVEIRDDTFVPPLPVRLDTAREKRIAYPVGRFSGRWSMPELAYAQELGHRVKITHGIVYTETAPIFREYMNRIWSNRFAARHHPALKQFHKTFGNSLYGKLGEGAERYRYFLNPSTEKVDASECPGNQNRYCRREADCDRCSESRCCSKTHGRFCKQWEPIDRDKLIYKGPYFLIPQNGHSHWACYLTSHTRIEWHRMAVSKNDGADLVYGDTDSIYSIDPRDRNIGDDLGQWGSDGSFQDFAAIAPKMYEFSFPPKVGEGPWQKKARAKGLGLGRVGWQDLEKFRRGEPIIANRGVKGFKTAAKSGNLFQQKHIERRNKQKPGRFGDRKLLAVSDGRTYPLRWEELNG